MHQPLSRIAHTLIRRTLPWLPVLAGLAGPLGAQTDYATPYTFSVLAGDPGVAGSSDGTGTAAQFDQPYGLAIDSSGNLYVADRKNQTIRKVTSGGVVTTIAGTPLSVGSTNGTGSAALFNEPSGVAVDSSGNLYVADTSNDVIRKVTSAGVVTTLVGTAGSPGSTDGTGSSALLNEPYSIAIDSSGNLYVADLGNQVIRKVTSGGVSSTFVGTAGTSGFANGTGSAAQFRDPTSIVIDSSGNLYVADSGNNAIRKITSGGVVTTLAGSGVAGSADGTGAGASFHSPRGIAIDSNGNLYVADSQNSTIRKVTAAGVVTTLAGTPGSFSSASGTGAAALFDTPVGIAVDGSGHVYVSNQLAYSIFAGTQATAIAPSFTLQPTSQTVSTASTVVFSVAANGLPAPTYQWLFNGAAISGATDPTLVISGATSANVGTYTCKLTNASGTLTSSPATLAVSSTQDVGRLVNLSCRTTAGSSSSTLIAGFAVGPGGVTGSETVLIRASGPALDEFAVQGTLPDPTLTLFSGTTALGTDYGWAGNAQVASAAASVGAFAWTNANSLDSALLESLSVGAYTAQVSGKSGDSGVALAEVYDTTPEASVTPTSPRLTNLSARSNVGTDANLLIAGFVIGGSTSKTVLIRASGPALVPFNVSGTLADPELQIFSGTTVIGTNAGWGGNAEIAKVAASVGAFAWTSPTSADSALLITLPPGAYTAQVSGVTGDTGIALVEVYDVP